jgi:hypothetical protein
MQLHPLIAARRSVFFDSFQEVRRNVEMPSTQKMLLDAQPGNQLAVDVVVPARRIGWHRWRELLVFSSSIIFLALAAS